LEGESEKKTKMGRKAWLASRLKKGGALKLQDGSGKKKREVKGGEIGRKNWPTVFANKRNASRARGKRWR